MSSIKSLSEIRTDLFTKINEIQLEYKESGWIPAVVNLNKGIFRGIMELFTFGLNQLYDYIDIILVQIFPSKATDSWLDIHCKQIGIERFEATKAEGVVYFKREGTTGNVSIPAGRVVKTLPDITGTGYSFITNNDAVLEDGNTEISVPVTALQVGTSSNVTAGQITEITTYIPGIDSVYNGPGWLTSEGTDIETDESLRERYLLKWTESDGCTKRAYESWARSVPGVSSVVVMDQHPRGQGTVDIVIIGSAGFPTDSLIDDVTAVIEDNKPINDDFLVMSPVEVLITISCELELTGGLFDDIKTDVENKIRSMFSFDSDDYFKISQDVTLSKLISVVMSVSPHIKNVIFSSPSADTEILNNELARLNELSVIYKSGEI